VVSHGELAGIKLLKAHQTIFKNCEWSATRDASDNSDEGDFLVRRYVISARVKRQVRRVEATFVFGPNPPIAFRHAKEIRAFRRYVAAANRSQGCKPTSGCQIYSVLRSAAFVRHESCNRQLARGMQPPTPG
jgi:hypothetical protein